MTSDNLLAITRDLQRSCYSQYQYICTHWDAPNENI